MIRKCICLIQRFPPPPLNYFLSWPVGFMDTHSSHRGYLPPKCRPTKLQKSTREGAHSHTCLPSLSCEAQNLGRWRGPRVNRVGFGGGEEVGAPEGGSEKRPTEKVLTWQIPLASSSFPNSIYFLSWRLETRRLAFQCFHCQDCASAYPEGMLWLALCLLGFSTEDPLWPQG